MRIYRRIAVILAALWMCVCLLCSCAGQGELVAYEDENHTHVYGYWYDADVEGQEIRYCRICHCSETRAKQ